MDTETSTVATSSTGSGAPKAGDGSTSMKLLGIDMDEIEPKNQRQLGDLINSDETNQRQLGDLRSKNGGVKPQGILVMGPYLQSEADMSGIASI